MYFMISNRNVESNGLGPDKDKLTFWTAAKGPLHRFSSWKSASEDRFRTLLLGEVDKFPDITDPAQNEAQGHVAFFIHGFNNSWDDAAKRYESLCGKLFTGGANLGVGILFSWPSDGMKTNYFPDRIDARESAGDLALVLSALYDWMLDKQKETMADGSKACRAKTSVIAHSMGNFVLQKAMLIAWTRKNQPMLVSLINQLLMVAADVDNDLFKSGEQSDKGDGDAIANLAYRVTALYSGKDSVLGMSAGFKHFGKRRLGRSGLDKDSPLPDNVWDIDCSRLFKDGQDNIHSAYFDVQETIDLMTALLRGKDRLQITLPS